MADEKPLDWGKFEVAPAPTSPSRDTLVVQCGNGHRLVVPASFAGKRVRCAKCQATFQVPLAGDHKPHQSPPVESRQAEGPPPTPPESSSAPMGASPDTAGESPAGPTGDASPAEDSPLPDEPAAATAPTPGRLPLTPPSIAGLVARLWQEVDRGGVIELHVAGGSVVLPKWFESSWSTGTHGLFASQAVDGSFTLTAVAWDSIQKVVVRNVGELPHGLFDDAGGRG